jgi:hypothetical protein
MRHLIKGTRSLLFHPFIFVVLVGLLRVSRFAWWIKLPDFECLIGIGAWSGHSRQRQGRPRLIVHLDLLDGGAGSSLSTWIWSILDHHPIILVADQCFVIFRIAQGSGAVLLQEDVLLLLLLILYSHKSVHFRLLLIPFIVCCGVVLAGLEVDKVAAVRAQLWQAADEVGFLMQEFHQRLLVRLQLLVDRQLLLFALKAYGLVAL